MRINPLMLSAVANIVLHETNEVQRIVTLVTAEPDPIDCVDIETGVQGARLGVVAIQLA